jgi:hypothetical protein
LAVPGLGAAVPLPSDGPPMDGATAGLGVGRSDGVPGVARGFVVEFGTELGRCVDPGDAGDVCESGRPTGAVPGVLGAALPVPAYPCVTLDDGWVAPPGMPGAVCDVPEKELPYDVGLEGGDVCGCD